MGLPWQCHKCRTKHDVKYVGEGCHFCGHFVCEDWPGHAEMQQKRLIPKLPRPRNRKHSKRDSMLCWLKTTKRKRTGSHGTFSGAAAASQDIALRATRTSIPKLTINVILVVISSRAAILGVYTPRHQKLGLIENSGKIISKLLFHMI